LNSTWPDQSGRGDNREERQRQRQRRVYCTIQSNELIELIELMGGTKVVQCSTVWLARSRRDGHFGSTIVILVCRMNGNGNGNVWLKAGARLEETKQCLRMPVDLGRWMFSVA